MMGQDGRLGGQGTEAWSLIPAWTLPILDFGQHPALSGQGLQQRSTSPDSGPLWADAAALTGGHNSSSCLPEDGGKAENIRSTIISALRQEDGNDQATKG